MSHREHITRRTLPHWYMPGAAHFVTYRLANTLPHSVLLDLRRKKESLLRRKPDGRPEAVHRQFVHKQLFAEYDEYLDRAQDIRWLSDPRVADVVRGNLYHHDGDKYHLLSWCIMSNHVHVLFIPRIDPPPADFESLIGETADARSPLAKIMHSLKSFTAHEANRVLGRTGSFWQHESYDHWVRDNDELERIVMYIRANPVKAGLVDRPELWKYSSCHDRQIDGDDSGWLLP